MQSWIFTPERDPLEGIRTFINNPALRELVELSGGTWPQKDYLSEQVAALVDFSDAWDRRKGGSRLDIVQTVNDQALADRILVCVAQLGLVEPQPPRGGHYDWLLILGGLATGCRSRTEFVAGLLAAGSISTDQVCLLGSFRELHEAERADAAAFAPGATTEVGMLQALAEHQFPSDARWHTVREGDPAEDPRAAQLSAHRDGKPALSVYAARSSDPQRNANSADTYRQFAHDVQLNGGRLLLISTHIYAPYQHWDAVRVLGVPYRAGLETVGTPPSASRRVFDSAWYLQETRSALRSAAALIQAVEE
ncbi:hypothetical protein [Streptomyces sviceus]|uniref:hypothetical protein n=1 Tax=Streptomyces sviceus TaxID=285530 RepID=UPI00367F27A4